MITILILLAPGFETSEAIVPIDFLRMAGITVTIASVGVPGLVVRDTSGVAYVCDARFEDVKGQDFGGVIVPGGNPGAWNLAANADVVELVKTYFAANKLVSSICAATAIVLADKCNIVNGKKVVGYPAEALNKIITDKG